jgi:hypothetical protein
MPITSFIANSLSGARVYWAGEVETEVAKLCEIIATLELQLLIAESKITVKSYTALGESLTISEWAKKTGLLKRTIQYRISRGWDVEKAVTLSATVGNNQCIRY